jgi:hypothetical protein
VKMSAICSLAAFLTFSIIEKTLLFHQFNAELCPNVRHKSVPHARPMVN